MLHAEDIDRQTPIAAAITPCPGLNSSRTFSRGAVKDGCLATALAARSVLEGATPERLPDQAG